MNKKTLIVFIFIILIFGIFLVSSFDGDKVDEEVYEGLEKNDSVRVIVKLKEPNDGKGSFIKTTQKIKISEDKKKEIKQEVIEEIGINKIRHDFGEEFSLDISSDELNKIKDNKNVESIKASGKVHAFLQDSVPYINASVVWPINISNQNITGINETICILDTGIDFSHPALVGKNKTCNINCITESCVENCSINDDNGHGTHVAGIAAANGSINGVAIGASLIGIKVLNSAGNGDFDDIYAGIEWCIANRIAYNISVISMSLGDCSTHNTYCNLHGSAAHINNATAYNLSVIVSAGNGNTGICNGLTVTNGPSAPACVENATAVGSITDLADSLYSSYQRGNLFELMAPGIGINSTVPNGSCTFCASSGWRSLQGTSMAAPHVAGAFALFRQFFRLQKGRIPTPAEIKNILNSTGKQINDTGGTNLNYSRIDVFAAIDSLRIPEVTRVSPLNNSYLNLSNQNSTFICNSTSNHYSLTNITFSLWNSSSLVYNLTENITGINNQTNFSYNFSVDDIYQWNCEVYNNNSFKNSDSNFTITYDITKPQINLISPSNSSTWTSSSTVSFTYNVSGGTINNCSLIINNNTNQTNSSITINTTQTFTESLSNAVYNWSINCTDFANNINNSEERRLTVSYTAPVVVSNTGGGSSGGGGGGTPIKTYNPTLIETRAGYTQPLAKKDKIKFTLFDRENTQHIITLNSVDVNYVNLTIFSDPINILLGVGQSAKLNLSSSDYYDIYLKLNSVENNKANLTIQTIYEKIPIASEITGDVVGEDKLEEIEEEMPKRKLGETFIYALVLIFVVIGTIILLRKRTGEKKKQAIKKEYKEKFESIKPKKKKRSQKKK
jgi:subtilisin family serine protease